MNHNVEKVVILETSDVHGNILPIRYADNGVVESGMTKVSKIALSEREKCSNVLLIDNGDMLQGTPLTYYYAKVQKGGINPIIDVLNYIKYDACVVGNHEFNYGRDILNSAVSQSEFPWISANIIDKSSKKPLFGKPYIIKNFPCGIKAAVLGLTTKYIPNWENPNIIEDLEFDDVVETCRFWVDFIRKNEKPDVMIVSYHGGFERDVDTGEPTENLTGENQAYEICSKVPGIDVLLTGHQHRSIAGKKINGVLVMQPGTAARVVGRAELNLEYDGAKWNILNMESKLVSCSGVSDDSHVYEIVKDIEKKTQKWLDSPIGNIKGDMLIDDPMKIRTRDNAFIEFVNKVQMDAAGTDISNTALFDNTSKGFPCNVTMRDVVSNYIFPNTLKVIRITGQDIKNGLERSASYFEKYDGKKVNVSQQFLSPKPQHYNYDMWEGIEYEINISKNEGERVTKLNYNGSPIEMDKFYDVAMNNYRAGGGGDYFMYQGKKVVKDIPTDISELIADYILKRGTIEAAVNNNWKVVHD